MNTTEPTEPVPHQLHGESDGPGCPVSAMRPLDPDRHDKSKAARDAAWKKHEPNWRFRAPPLTFIVAWDAALDHAAQEQRNPVLGPECPKCGTIPLNLPPEKVAEIRALFPELDAQEQPVPPAAPTGSARDWLASWYDETRPAKHVYGFAVDLADRADAAERRLATSQRARKSLSDACDHLQAKMQAAREAIRTKEANELASAAEADTLRAQLAAAQDETRRLREALDNLCVAVAGAGVRHPKERELLQECYDAARAALAAQKEGEES